MELSKEARNQRRNLARRELKRHYIAVAYKSVCDRAAARLDPGSANNICKLRRQRAKHLRHVHLARAFLRGQPRDCVELWARGHRARYNVSPQYVVDIINGMCILETPIEMAEVYAWLNY